MASLPFDDSTAATWRDFGERAENAQAWQVARDVWLALLAQRVDLELVARAAQVAIRAGDAAGALGILRRAPIPSPSEDGARRVRLLVPVEVAALAELGRARDAQALAEANTRTLDAAARAALAPVLVGAWLRIGDVERARTAAQAGDLADDDETSGWLALYEGDLATARRRLVRAETRRPELVDALGLLARVRVDHSVGLGQAFLQMAKRDSTAAARQLVLLADSLPDAAPALLGMAARIHRVRGSTPEAIALWERIVRDAPRSPDAPDAMLSWARALVGAKDLSKAQATYERLLLEYPASALVPQGRRELDRLKGTP